MKYFSHTSIVVSLCLVTFGTIVFGIVPFPTNAQTTCTVEGILFDDATNQPVGTCVFVPPTPDPTSAAYQFQRGGIFGCNQTAAYRMSVGALSAVGGVYVPVNDAAVTLNTGYFVYKECVLDGVSRKMAESASTELANKALNDILTGRDGESFWIRNYDREILDRINKSFLHTLESGELTSVLHPAFGGDVQRAVVRNYQTQTQAANQVLRCPYQGDLEAVLKGQSNDWVGGLIALMNPVCNPLGAGIFTESYTDANAARAKEEFLFRINTGFYGVEEYDPVTGRYITNTPGSIVAGNLQQLVQSGLKQLENVTEIDQMVGALFSGLSTHVISDNRGLTGLLQSNLGQPSYLEQMTREASQGLRESAINAALQILSAARQVETTYLNAMNAIATNLTQTIGQLRSAENSCWALVVPAAQTYANQNGFQILAATSTTASQQIIDSQIAAPASVTVANVEKSEQALQLINRLIAGVTNTSSLEAQRLALQQLDSLVAQGLLHNQYDAQQATQRRGDVQTAMTTLVEDTIVAWADSPDTNIGWCNINNPEVGRIWAERWRR